jgi:hypothetical protein
MTKKQLLPLLIYHYEFAIIEVSKITTYNSNIHNMYIRHNMLRKLRVGAGICHCAYNLYN